MSFNWKKYCFLCFPKTYAFLVAQMVKNLPTTQEPCVQSLGREETLEKVSTTPLFLPGESPWTEEPGRLQSMGPQSVGQD